MRRRGQSRRGATLIELMVAVAIIGILSALAIPAFIVYKKRAYLSEASANIQGILEAEQGFFVRFQRYTAALPVCPPVLPAQVGAKQLFNPAACGGDWLNLGWKPDDAVAFQYRAYSAYDATGARIFHPTSNPPPGMSCPGGKCYGVDFAAELSANVATMQPWIVVEAVGDTDRDGQQVFLQTNNLNSKIFITPQNTY